MPPPLNLPDGEYKAHVKEQARLRQRKHRAVGHVTTKEGSVTDHVTGARQGTNGRVTPPAPPVETSSLREVEEVRSVLERFSDRGYQHDPKWWLRLAKRYPDVDLYLVAGVLAEWLLMPVHRKESCSKGRITNFVKRAQADGGAAGASRPMVLTNGTPYQQPITQQGRNPGPPDLPLFEAPVQRIDPAEMARFVAGRRDTPLAEKLKARQGRH